jgi:hypothetical protein
MVASSTTISWQVKITRSTRVADAGARRRVAAGPGRCTTETPGAAEVWVEVMSCNDPFTSDAVLKMRC